MERKTRHFTAKLQTIGRRTGRPHIVLVGLVRHRKFIYTSTQNCSKKDWCLNLIKNPRVLIKTENEELEGIARPIVDESPLRLKILQELCGPSRPGKWPIDAVIEIEISS
ncbi:MAG: nitroreductase/quinone reductase family protein, partial [Candidatus Bathyarchaeia archaeon]